MQGAKNRATFLNKGTNVFSGKQASAAHCQSRRSRGFDWSGIVHRKNGLLVPPRDAGAIAEAILVLLDDEPKRKAMGGEGRRMAEGFSAEGMIEKINALYEQLSVRL